MRKKIHCNFIVDAKDDGFCSPDTEKIECSKCKFKAFFMWEGKKIDNPVVTGCKKYKYKPEGILFPDKSGTYTKCPCFEKE